MPQTRPPARAFAPGRAARQLGVVALGGLVLSAVYATTGRGIPCPFLALTGWRCPLCGSTRLGAALLHGEVGVAFGLNPLVYIGLLLAGVLAVVWLVEAAGGPALRPSPAWTRRIRRVSPWTWLALGGVVLALWTVARNLL